MPFMAWDCVSKRFGQTRVLDRVSLSMERSEILALLGPSGSGKSTLLRVTAGLEAADGGGVLREGRDLSGVPPHRRGMGLMFQDFCLFPHLDVAGNVGFGLRMMGWPREGRAARVREALALVRLEGFERRRVHSLSGGEQQRVALARSLAPLPDLLMLDEPLGSLDAVLRGELVREIRDILKRAGATVLYVTHDQEEAMSVADRVALLRQGRVVQAGPPQELMSFPADAQVARFLELGALVPARLFSDRMETGLGALPLPGRLAGQTGQGLLLIRPSAVSLHPLEAAARVSALVISHTPRPDGMVTRLALAGKDEARYELAICWEQRSGDGLEQFPPGSQVCVSVNSEETLLFREQG
jgi:thiamine transport system ATP-binding protein